MAEAVTDLVAAGASLLGGCCRVVSTEIRQLRASILRATSGSSGQ
ncbi:homocysteine S-methyltransferase family protein [Corynebacterium tuberculostearicum]|nr:homocysteine S-methyltransferase family protein [Corynebacterium tuberculostearicum]MDK8677614.1 homocysteine S-methyltransferase family protein [Corynebacterium tuberculostearicum]